jgi:hypothetical protein
MLGSSKGWDQSMGSSKGWEPLLRVRDAINATSALSGALAGTDVQGRLLTANEIQDPERRSRVRDAINVSSALSGALAGTDVQGRS